MNVVEECKRDLVIPEGKEEQKFVLNTNVEDYQDQTNIETPDQGRAYGPLPASLELTKMQTPNPASSEGTSRLTYTH